MINVVVIVISALMLVFVVVWWRWPAFRLRTEAPKYFVLQQEHRFNEKGRCDHSDTVLSAVE